MSQSGSAIGTQTRQAMWGAALALSLLGLASCNPNADEYAPQCPAPKLLGDAASLAQYRGAGTDLTDLVLTGRLLNVQGACSGIQGGHRVKAHAHVDMLLTRGPAATSDTVDVPYAMGIVRDGEVLEEKALNAHVTFPPNVNTVRVRGEDVDMLFTTRRGHTAAEYSLYFWFQLTPAELAANRAALP